MANAFGAGVRRQKRNPHFLIQRLRCIYRRMRVTPRLHPVMLNDGSIGKRDRFLGGLKDGFAHEPAAIYFRKITAGDGVIEGDFGTEAVGYVRLHARVQERLSLGNVERHGSRGRQRCRLRRELSRVALGQIAEVGLLFC